MTAAAKSQSQRDAFGRQFRPINQQVTSSVQTPPEDVGVRRHSHTLTKRALEMTNADARKRGQGAQFDWLSECVFYVLENQLEPAARKAPDRPRRSRRQGRIVVNQMVR